VLTLQKPMDTTIGSSAQRTEDSLGLCKTKRSIHSPFSHMDSAGQPSSESRRHSTHPRITNRLRVRHRHRHPATPGRVRTHVPTTVRPSGPDTGTAAEEKGRRQKQAQTTNPSHDAAEATAIGRQTRGSRPKPTQPRPCLVPNSTLNFTMQK
jgi:hypothetical protein